MKLNLKTVFLLAGDVISDDIDAVYFKMLLSFIKTFLNRFFKSENGKNTQNLLQWQSVNGNSHSLGQSFSGNPICNYSPDVGSKLEKSSSLTPL